MNYLTHSTSITLVALNFGDLFSFSKINVCHIIVSCMKSPYSMDYKVILAYKEIGVQVKCQYAASNGSDCKLGTSL